jgi:hypothetical protein
MDVVALLVILVVAGALFVRGPDLRRPGRRVPDHVPVEWTREWRERRRG